MLDSEGISSVNEEMLSGDEEKSWGTEKMRILSGVTGYDDSGKSLSRNR